jgi:hypothetical protein
MKADQPIFAFKKEISIIGKCFAVGNAAVN